ncbi:polyketide synthase [Streptomyces hesseae]|uniref:Beta-ketoacyl synthase N-terminal-like domain-containing protein n=1 Tax=Streptomyces hesseae TaxID=3075519 RepID=A0ABU2SFJ2_9ACTN|nr:polyketide synthase [Streptomyces sp. DSM 40473]MDT0447752.1 beta-ketoacyl synthase N-terminal-like domain-containing protein [Streptomyces sp. DSM 40473]
MPVRTTDYTIDPPAGSPGALGGFTLPDVFQAAVNAAPDAVALVDGDRSRTWRQWHADVDALARGLQELGIVPGDVVAAHLPNSWEFPTLHLAVAAVGAVLLPVHQGNGPKDVHALLSRVEPALAVLPAATQDGGEHELTVRHLLRTVPSLGTVLLTGAAGEAQDEPGTARLDTLLATWSGSAPHPVAVTPDMPFVLIPSSGTTSARPKICLHSHDGLLSNTSAVTAEAPEAFARAVVTACPLTHLFGLQSLHSALFAACRQVLLRSWDPDRFLALAREADPSVVFAVPAQLHDVVTRLAETGEPAGFRPHEVRTAGAAVPGALVTGVRAALDCALVVVWGMSELGTGTRTGADDPADVATRSVGLPTSGAEVRVVDEDGRDCPPGTVGELRYRSPGMFRGYYRDPELTRAAVTDDGWLRTGDLAVLGGDGRVAFHGRSAEIVNVGGRKFNATEIQGLLADLPGVGPLAVLGVPDPRLGEYPCLVVTEKADPSVGLAEVTDFLLRRGVADYKIPLELVTVPELPLTPAGKLHRRALEKALASGEIARGPVCDGPDRRPCTVEEALDLVRTCVADVLAHLPADTVPAEVTFRDLGLDSVLAIRLRNLLQEATGLPLPTTLAFDFPTPLAVARALTGHPDEEAARQAVPARGADPEEPIAVIGMACRLPGGAHSPEELWALLADGTDAVSGFPTGRGWDLDRLFDADPEHLGTTYAREGGFLHDAGHFDAGFFGLSDREALATDPQQRLLLETSWEALERAGIDPTALKGTRTGVFTGAMYHDYATDRTGAAAGLEGLLGIGTAASALSGRIAYAYGFEGPALTVDTACSSSLVALHLACQSLRSGESSLALAGGVAVMATPASFVEFSRLRGLSPDGRCKSFADAADGTAWSEGAGLLLLERLSDARRNGHPVLALVRGSAVNQDGASNGITAPNGPSQQRVIRQALANAGLSARDVDTVEAHGTGTALGDPIEAQALLATYGRDRDADRPLWLGSVKSNLGHAQAAAGVAGVIKTVLALRHGVLPKTLHLDEPSSHVDWSAGAVELLTEARAWPREDGRTRRAGVSSFGISGTNAHVILEEPPADAVTPAEPSGADGPAAPWVLSARTDAALRAQALRLAEYARANPALPARDIGYSLATTRALHGLRAVVTGSSREELLAATAAFASGERAPGAVRDESAPGDLAFVFTGQGSQRLGMGRRAAAAFPVFGAALREVCAALDPLLERPLTSVMWAAPDSEEAGLLDDTAYAQPALFAVEVALHRLFTSWGVVPDHLVGHSVGEITAAHVAGILGLRDACALVAARGRLMGALPPGGTMVAVRIAEDELTPWLAGLDGTVSVAAVNGPRSVVLSGAEGPLTGLADRLAAAGHKTRQLVVSHGFHSPLMEPMLAEFREVVEGLSFAAPSVPVVSALTGRLLTAEEARDPGHWVRHVREPVRFKDAVDRLRSGPAATTCFLELGPDPALTPMIDECVQATTVRPGAVTIVPTLTTGQDEARAALTAAARLHAHGASVDWRAVLPAAVPVALPTYAFQRREYWVTSAAATAPPVPAVVPSVPSLGDDGGASPLRDRLAGLDGPERDELLLGLVLAEVTAVLGGRGPWGEEASAQPFTEMGVTSVNAIELRGRITEATGVRLPATLVFDHPTPDAVVALLRERLEEAATRSPRGVAGLVDELEYLLSTGVTVNAETAARLRALATRWGPEDAPEADAPESGLDLDSASDEELFRLMDGG